MISKELFERFISNGTTPEESAQVMEYLRKNPSALDNLMNDEEWEEFRFSERLHPAVSRLTLGKIRKATYEKYRFLRKTGGWMAAASVILLAGLGWLKFGYNRKQEMTGKTAVVLENRPVLQHKHNSSSKTISFVLKDGSQLDLGPHSEISYEEPFGNDRRDIYLDGMASFNVAQDKSRPFSVFSGKIATTALGTRFLVVSNKEQSFIKVKLFEGRVVVRPVVAAERKEENEKYLLPGNELIYDKHDGTAKVFVGSGDNTGKGDPNRRNDHALARVFLQLEEMYGVQIKCSGKDINNKYFFGDLNTSDPIDTIIDEIALLNELSVSKQGKTFILKSIQH